MSAALHNLVHYLALRRHDLRSLQAHLTGLGLSSLGRTESHVLSSIQRVIQLLNVLQGRTQRKGLVYDAPVEIGKGAELLDRHTRALLGRVAALSGIEERSYCLATTN